MPTTQVVVLVRWRQGVKVMQSLVQHLPVPTSWKMVLVMRRQALRCLSSWCNTYLRQHPERWYLWWKDRHWDPGVPDATPTCANILRGGVGDKETGVEILEFLVKLLQLGVGFLHNAAHIGQWLLVRRHFPQLFCPLLDLHLFANLLLQHLKNKRADAMHMIYYALNLFYKKLSYEWKGIRLTNSWGPLPHKYLVYCQGYMRSVNLLLLWKCVQFQWRLSSPCLIPCACIYIFTSLLAIKILINKKVCS